MKCLYCPNTKIEAHNLCSKHYQRWRHRRSMEFEYFPKGWVMGGYRWISLPGGREIREHRYIMEQHIGRELHASEYVHHINGVKTDNRIGNLQIMDPANHTRHHCGHEPIKRKCLMCGRDFIRPAKQNFRVIKTCSHSCGSKMFWKARHAS